MTKPNKPKDHGLSIFEAFQNTPGLTEAVFGSDKKSKRLFSKLFSTKPLAGTHAADTVAESPLPKHRKE